MKQVHIRFNLLALLMCVLPGSKTLLMVPFCFMALFMQDDKSFIVFRKSIGSFLECGSDDDFDLENE
jgi:hypothetical protein